MLAPSLARKGLAGAFIIIALLGALPAIVTSPANADPTVSISPPSLLIYPGDLAELQVRVDDSGDPISCFIVHIHFDPDVFAVRDVVEGNLYAGQPTYPGWELIAPDTLEIYNCIIGTGTFVLGPGSLADIEIEAEDVGVSPVELAFVQVRDIDRIPYGDPGAENGEVYVWPIAGMGDGDSGGGAAAAGAGVAGPLRLEVSPNPAPGWALIRAVGGGGEGTAAAAPPGPPGAPIDIYDIHGRLRCTLPAAAAPVAAGRAWDGCDERGAPLAAGIYVIRLRGAAGASAKLLLVP